MIAELIAVNPGWILPFVLLLGMIAMAPLLCPDWWLRHYPKVAIGLGAVVVIYYAAGLHAGARIGEAVHEYVSFIALIGALFVVAGGIHIQVKGPARPLGNALFLLVGAIAANFLGTTGASMLLIRPWLRMNHYRIAAHHVMFFILLVSNVGGCLTPIGDSPLFLGYLQGIPFWWVAEHCLPMWGVAMVMLLVMFLAVDTWHYRKSPSAPVLEAATNQWRCEGWGNLVFLGIIIGSVFLERPAFLREGLMLGAALGSYFTTRKSVHAANHFDFHPIQEVAILFIGIFTTMMPALDWLQGNAAKLELNSSSFFFWGAGTLSSLLDNAPTYLCFLKTLIGRFVDPVIITQVADLIRSHAGMPELTQLAGAHADEIRATFATLQKFHAAQLAAGSVTPDEIGIAYLLGNARFNGYIVAISVGAVFFGANTYIGNGPNFMVKSIAEHQKVKMPSFFGYLGRYTLPFMVPVLVVVWWLFFRG